MAATESRVGAKSRSVVESHLTDDDSELKANSKVLIGDLEQVIDCKVPKRRGTNVDVREYSDNNPDNDDLEQKISRQFSEGAGVLTSSQGTDH